jgi:hypothetical protein
MTENISDYHKGEQCPYIPPLTCQEGYCSRCEIYLKYKRREQRCIDCKYCRTQYITGYDGTGTYAASICEQDFTRPVLVDPGALRYCEKYLKTSSEGLASKD